MPARNGKRATRSRERRSPRGGSVKTSCSSQSTRAKSKRSAQAGKNTWKNSAKNAFNNDLNRWSWSTMACLSAGASGLSSGYGAVARNYATLATSRQGEDGSRLRAGAGSLQSTRLKRIAGSEENDYRRFLLVGCLEAYVGLDEAQNERPQALLQTEPTAMMRLERHSTAGIQSIRMRSKPHRRFPNRYKPSETRCEPWNFGLNIDGVPFHLLVADVTREQLDQLQRDPSFLPPGWSLDGNQLWSRRR